jgi:N-acetylglucosamine-6-phosphate deacetylase
MATALKGARIFDGEIFHTDSAVLVEGAEIAAIVSHHEIPSGVQQISLAAGLLVPGFIDVQVNGGGSALLNDRPSVDVVKTIAESHRRFGTINLLPTVITDAPEVIAAAIEAVRQARAEGISEVLGIHVEGPFLDPVRKGAHDPKFIRPITEEDVEMLGNADCGIVMLTAAPNRVSPEVIRALVAKGVRVSLGHSDATYAETQAALSAGATSFTHLFNAMSQMTGREPGMVGAALTDAKSYIGIIADGHHVNDAMLKLAFSTASTRRFMLVSDAMTPAAGGPDRFMLQGRKVDRINGRLQLADGTLAGSNLTMDEALRYAVDRLEVPLEATLQMASRNPANFLGRGDLGRISIGARANLVHLDDQLKVRQTWVGGKSTMIISPTAFGNGTVHTSKASILYSV